MSEPKAITVNRVDASLLKMQRDTMLEILADGGLPKGRQSALDGVVNLLDAMLDSAEECEGIGPSLTERESSIDGCTVVNVDTPHDWPENENGPILRIYLNDDDIPIFNNPR